MAEPHSSTLEFSNDVKTVILEIIKLADDKAKAAFAVSAALLIYLFNGGALPKPDLTLQHPTDIMRFVLICVSMVSLAISGWFALMVLIPRMFTAHQGLVFFGSIAKWPSSDAYADKIIQCSSVELQRESAMHNFEISRVALKKFAALRRCLVLTALGVFVAI